LYILCKFDTFYGHLVDFTAIWYTYFILIWYIFPVLVSCIKVNLATLVAGTGLFLTTSFNYRVEIFIPSSFKCNDSNFVSMYEISCMRMNLQAPEQNFNPDKYITYTLTFSLEWFFLIIVHTSRRVLRVILKMIH
jgi:hypothetical protein